MTHARVQNIRSLLQKALELELFTIPPYLTALYSLRAGVNGAVAQILQGVVMEEMLHMALVANVMNAVGASPRLSDGPHSASSSRRSLRNCRYPSKLPHVDIGLLVSLEKFAPETVRTFMKIEEPEDPADWYFRGNVDHPYRSIGHFYSDILDELIAACKDLGERSVFVGEAARQVGGEYYYGGGGRVMEVHNLDTAKDAIAVVAQQGEGRRRITNLTGDHERFGQPKEVAHYFRFEQILAGRYYEHDDNISLGPRGRPLRVDWDAVYPVACDDRSSDARRSGLQPLADTFRHAYAEVLYGLHRGFNGEQAAIVQAVTAMHRVKHTATELMQLQNERGHTVAPPFWFVIESSEEGGSCE